MARLEAEEIRPSDVKAILEAASLEVQPSDVKFYLEEMRAEMMELTRDRFKGEQFEEFHEKEFVELKAEVEQLKAEIRK